MKTFKQILAITTIFAGLSHHLSAEKVGILQVVDHLALNQTCKGIIDKLAEEGVSTKGCQSAQDKTDMALQIVQQFVGQPVEVIVAIATMPSQVAVKSAQGRPVVFASVTDPKAAKLFEVGASVTGVSNRVDLAPRVIFFKKILKQERPKIGVIYNCGDPNSVTLVEEMQADKSVEWEFVVARNVSEIAQATQKLLTSGVHAIFINNDNTALSAFETIVRLANTQKIPVFCSDIDMIDKGALAALGPDQYDIGLQAGEMVLQILKGKPAKDIQMAYPRKIATYINMSVAKKLEIDIPQELAKSAKLVGG